MTKRVRITAVEQDPVLVNQLVRLLIAQAQQELSRERTSAGTKPNGRGAKPRAGDEL